MTDRKPQGGVERAVRAELRRLCCSVATDGSSALAVALARQIDTARGAVAAAAAAGQLRQLLIDVRKMAAEARPERDVVDDLGADELAARRAAG
jgi:hypothetical protein